MRETGLTVGELTLALHTWDDGRSGLTDLFYVHGLQSHTGWLCETGPALLERGVRLSVLDRRGSGRSQGARGHLPDAQTVLDDYAAALARVIDAAAGPVAVLGQSFGGSVVAALVATGRIPAGSLIVLAAPALGQQRSRLTPDARAQALRDRSDAYSVVQLEDEQYTDLPEYLRLMANDGLMVRALTAAFRATMLELEDRYLVAGPACWAGHPVRVALPEQDSIIDLEVSSAVLARLAPHAVVRTFPVTRHYLEFTTERQRYWDWLAAEVRAGATC